MAKWYRTKSFKICFQIVLILIIFIAELHTGIFSNSTALVADSFHALSDVISLCVGLVAVRTAHKKPKPNSRKTFGNQRAEVLGGIVQAVFLYALCFHIYTESFKRFTNRQEQNDIIRILIVGGIGLIANLLGLWMFCDTGSDHGHTHGHSHGQSHNDGQNLNTRGIWLHIMGDTLGSVSVMISSGILMYYSQPAFRCSNSEKWSRFPDRIDPTCNDLQNFRNLNNLTNSCHCELNSYVPLYEVHSWLTLLDPALTFLIATIICASTYPLFVKSMHILMENCPKEIDFESFRKHLEKVVLDFGKIKIIDLHIWQLNSDKGVATIKLQIETGSCKFPKKKFSEISNYQNLVKRIMFEFEELHVDELTIMPEFVCHNLEKIDEDYSQCSTTNESDSGIETSEFLS